MNSYRKLRFPILIGAGVIAAGALLYQTNSRISSQHVQGAIEKRDVYRDAQGNASDVQAPGTAPVATKALLESKEFRALAKNPAFQSVLANVAFQGAVRNQVVASVMASPAFADLANNAVFAQYLSSGAFANLAANVRADMAQADLTQAVHISLAQANAQGLASNVSFNAVMQNVQFLSAMNSQAARQNLVSLLKTDSFAALAKDSLFQGMLMQSQYRDALASGISANLVQSAAVQ